MPQPKSSPAEVSIYAAWGLRTKSILTWRAWARPMQHRSGGPQSCEEYCRALCEHSGERRIRRQRSQYIC